MTVWLQGGRDGQVQPDVGEGAPQGGHVLEDEHGYVVAEEDLMPFGDEFFLQSVTRGRMQ